MLGTLADFAKAIRAAESDERVNQLVAARTAEDDRRNAALERAATRRATLEGSLKAVRAEWEGRYAVEAHGVKLPPARAAWPTNARLESARGVHDFFAERSSAIEHARAGRLPLASVFDAPFV